MHTDMFSQEIGVAGPSSSKRRKIMEEEEEEKEHSVAGM